ncbi:MFS general substrate transporter [Trametopsis cervina]|nr:MFS general substrate transporter [Trametopsis cervina]
MTEHKSTSDLNVNMADARVSMTRTRTSAGDLVSVDENDPQPTPKDLRFWMVFLAVCASLFLSALEFTVVSSALPTIIHDLNGTEFSWIPSAYSLASTALLPASGGFAQIFGRRATILASLAMFALGSALCGAAKTSNWLIAARTVQGAGGGGILSLGSIIVSDMVTLQERGTYNGFIGMTWALASGIGPVIGGALASSGQWRWIFYLNLPICGVAAALVIVFLDLPTPPGSLKNKLRRVDWIGNAIIIASSSSCLLALTWGGVTFPWVSVHVLLPLILGLLGSGIFLIYEALVAKEPIVPYSLFKNRTSLGGYIQTFIVPMITIPMIYFVPVYFQACKGASPLRSGVLSLNLCLSLAPGLLATGISIARSHRYRPQIWAGWILQIVSAGAMTTVHADTPVSHAVGLPTVGAVGSGILYAGTYFPVLAPLPVTDNAHALAFFSFCRSLAGAWGISIGTSILQTQLGQRLPAEFMAKFPEGVSAAYAIIPLIPTLEEETRNQVRFAFAESLIVVWQVLIGISGIGLVASLFMKGLPLHTDIDRKWVIDRAQGVQETEMQNAQMVDP